MKIRDIMTHQVASVNPRTNVVEAAQLMHKHDVGAIPVCEGEKILGILTDRDIVVRNIALGRDPYSTPVQDIMTTKITSVNPEMSLNQAAGIMANEQIRRVPVVENEKLVGMVSLGDLATKAKYDVELARTLGDISFPSEPEKI